MRTDGIALALVAAASACGAPQHSGATAEVLYNQALPVHLGHVAQSGEPYGVESRLEIRTPTTRETVRFAAGAHVGREDTSQVTYFHVVSMEGTRNGAGLASLPAETFVETAPAEAPQPTRLRVDGHAPPEELASLLPLVATVRIAPVALEDAFGGDTPRRPGDTWGLRAGGREALARELSLEPDLQGEARFEGYAELPRGEQCMELTIAIRGTPAAASGEPANTTPRRIVVNHHFHLFVHAWGHGNIYRTEWTAERIERAALDSSREPSRDENREVTYRFLEVSILYPP
jgi:hypothetical protein